MTKWQYGFVPGISRFRAFTGFEGFVTPTRSVQAILGYSFRAFTGFEGFVTTDVFDSNGTLQFQSLHRL